jgi:flagellar motor switch protein FliN/FliY
MSAKPTQNVKPVDMEDLRAQPAVGTNALFGLEDAGQLQVSVAMEVGRRRMTIRDLLQLNVGSVVELNTATGDAFDVLVNGVWLASGEPVAVNEKLGIRVTNIVRAGERVSRREPR